MEGTGILKENQAGFRNGRGTRDHISVFNSIINNKLKRKGGKLFTAFVDFKAAYDTVDTDIMMEKLRKPGIKGRLYRIIGKIYEETVNEVITNEGMTERFRTARGIRQWCALSPLLFSLFSEWGSVIGKKKIFAMKFADDVVLLADEAEDLRSMLTRLEKYVNRNKLTVNINKTKILIFRKGRGAEQG